MKAISAEMALCLLATMGNGEAALPTTLLFIEGEADSLGGLYCEDLGGTRSDLDCAIAAARHPMYRYGFYIDVDGCHTCRTQDPWTETSEMEVQRPRPLHIQGNVLQIDSVLKIELDIFVMVCWYTWLLKSK